MPLTHFFLSLLFLALVVLVVAGYVYAACFLARYVLQVVRGLERRTFSLATFVPARSLWRPPHSAVVTCFLALACLLLVASLYVYERNRWIRPESAWKPAKEYMAVGFVILDLRVWAARYVYPERAVCRPLVWLQRAVCRAGRRLIPETDGEHALWQYYFELAPYTNRTHAPQTSEILQLITVCKEVLDGLVNREIADPVFREKERYLAHTMTAFYFCWVHGRKYCPDFSCSLYDEGNLFQDRPECELLLRVVDELVAAESRWPEHPLVVEHVRSHPDFELVHICTVLLLLRDILYFKIQNIEYTCGDPHVDMFYRYSERLHAEDSPYKRVPEKMQSSLRKAVVYHGTWENFFGHRLCNRPKLPSYSITDLGDLARDPFSWDIAYIRLVKKLFPPERYKEMIERLDP